MNTERLLKVTAADMSGNVIEWYVEPGPGKLAYFTEQQARSLLVWSLRTGKLSDLRAGEILERARRTQNAGAHIAGNVALGISELHLGALTHARAHFERAIGSYRGVEAARLSYEYGVDLGAPSYAYAAWCSWLLGYPDQALRLGDEALVIPERMQHAYTRSPRKSSKSRSTVALGIWCRRHSRTEPVSLMLLTGRQKACSASWTPYLAHVWT